MKALALTSFWPPPLSQSACNPSSSQNLPACQTSCHGCRGLLLIQAEGRRVSRIPVQLACWAPQAACRPEAMADADVIPVDWTTAYPQLAETFSKLLLWSLQLTFQFGNFVYVHSLFFFFCAHAAKQYWIVLRRKARSQWYLAESGIRLSLKDVHKCHYRRLQSCHVPEHLVLHYYYFYLQLSIYIFRSFASWVLGFPNQEDPVVTVCGQMDRRKGAKHHCFVTTLPLCSGSEQN